MEALIEECGEAVRNGIGIPELDDEMVDQVKSELVSCLLSNARHNDVVSSGQLQSSSQTWTKDQ